jgi:integral membrane sensor domain MASE1
MMMIKHAVITMVLVVVVVVVAVVVVAVTVPVTAQTIQQQQQMTTMMMMIKVTMIIMTAIKTVMNRTRIKMSDRESASLLYALHQSGATADNRQQS